MTKDLAKTLWDDLDPGDLVTSKGLEPADGFTAESPSYGIVLELCPYSDSNGDIPGFDNCDVSDEGYVSILWDDGRILEFDVRLLKDPREYILKRL